MVDEYTQDLPVKKVGFAMMGMLQMISFTMVLPSKMTIVLGTVMDISRRLWHCKGAVLWLKVQGPTPQASCREAEYG